MKTGLAPSASLASIRNRRSPRGARDSQESRSICDSASAGNGAMVALGQRTRDKVRLLHAKALEMGGTDQGGPGVRGQEGSNAFYAAYVRDLDGNKLCFYCVGPADA